MAIKRVEFLRPKTLKSGKTLWFWEPSAALRKAGWTALALGSDEDAAFKAAEKRNGEVATWKAGGARPATVRRMIKAATVGALIAHYKAPAPGKVAWPKLSDMSKPIAATTRSTYSAAFDKIEAWAGDVQITAITPARVRAFRDGLLAGFGQTTAYNTLSALRTLFRYGYKIGLADKTNPADEFGLAAPDPRTQIWDEDGGSDLAAFAAGAAAIGHAELAFALELFEHLGQREADMLKLQASQWREIKNLPAEEREILAHADGPDAGKVMGFFVRQGKTQRWVGVPIAGELRRKVEAQIASNRARDVAVTTILVNQSSGRPWSKRYFIDRFNAAKDHAVADLRKRGLVDDADRLDGLQIRDLRRTAVVRMGELNLEDHLIAAITGHKLGTIKKILEVYMPRTTKMAARAIVARMADHRATAAAAQRERSA